MPAKLAKWLQVRDRRFGLGCTTAVVAVAAVAAARLRLVLPLFHFESHLLQRVYAKLFLRLLDIDRRLWLLRLLLGLLLLLLLVLWCC